MPYVDPIPDAFICPLSEGTDVMKDPVTYDGRVYDRQNLKAHFQNTGQNDVSDNCIPDKVLKGTIEQWVAAQISKEKQFERLLADADQMEAQMQAEAEKAFRQRDAEQAVLGLRAQAPQEEHNEIAASKANAARQGLKETGQIQDNSFDVLLKFGFVGPSEAGKSALVDRLTNHTFREQYRSTIGTDISNLGIESEGKIIRLQLNDEAGQERFRQQSKLHAMDMVFLVIDLTNPKTLSEAEDFLKNHIRVSCKKGVDVVLVGNKADARVKAISPEAVARFAQENKLAYFEVSAKTGDNVFAMINAGAQIANTSLINRAKESEIDKNLVKAFRPVFEKKFAGSFTFFKKEVDKTVNSKLSQISADELRKTAAENPDSVTAKAWSEITGASANNPKK